MKKLMTFISLFTLILNLTACKDKKEKLFILNWGEYMDMDVISDFEKEYNVEVIYEETATNEEMYTKLVSGTSKFDIMFPSEYMVDKMIEENLLQELDEKVLTNSNLYYPKVMEMLQAVDKDNKYAVPYAWGNLGIMYNLEFEDIVHEKGFGVLFEKDSRIKNVGMYDSSRDSIASALLYLGYSVNTSDLDELKEAEELLNSFKYKVFLDDAMKTNIVTGNLDVALTYSGDFLVQAYQDIEDGIDISYGYYAPDRTNLWVDSMVIPYNALNPSLANDFISFVQREENSLRIAKFIGDCPVMPSIVEEVRKDENLQVITLADNFIPYREGMTAEVYTYNGKERYQILDDIYTRIKGKY